MYKFIHHVNIICIFAAFSLRSLRLGGGWKNILFGVCLTLYSQCRETSQLSVKFEDIATVDAHGMYFGMACHTVIYRRGLRSCLFQVFRQCEGLRWWDKQVEFSPRFLFAFMRFQGKEIWTPEQVSQTYCLSSKRTENERKGSKENRTGTRESFGVLLQHIRWQQHQSGPS